MSEPETPVPSTEPILPPGAPLPTGEARLVTSGALRPRLAGALLCAVSAAGFASLTILGKLAFEQNLSLVTILSLRFGGAALILFGYLRLVKQRRIYYGLRQTAPLFLLGALGYAVQSSLYFGALQRNPASVNGLLLYIYPAVVALFGWLVNRKAPHGREWFAMLLALLGVAFTIGGAGGMNLERGGVNPLGVAMVIGSAVWYSGYIVISDRYIHLAGAWVSTAWITLGASVSFTLAGLATGTLNLRIPPNGILIILAMIFLSTIVALGTFLAGMRLVGPTTASLLSTLEPVFTVLLAVWLLRESLQPTQILGGGLVLAAVVLLSLPSRAAIAD
ncbi:MAG: DMT family transporter [Anaerolineales bacterium]